MAIHSRRIEPKCTQVFKAGGEEEDADGGRWYAEGARVQGC